MNNAIPATMRAARLREIDGTVRLVVDEVDVPTPGPGEVLIRVRACGLNQVDLLTRDGKTPADVPLPHVSGTEVAGDVAAVGEGVTKWRGGERVVVDPVLSCGECAFCRVGRDNMCLRGRIYGVQTHGGYAEYAIAPAAQLLPLPDHMDHATAAAVAVTGPTAWHMLRRRADVRIGEDVLVIAAGAGIGVLAVQIARLAGARVIATAGSPDKMARAVDLGADHVVNHRDPEWADQVRAWTGGRGVDLVFEHVGAATWEGSLHAMARGGRLVTSGGHSGFTVSLDLWHLFVKEHTVIGSFAGSRQDLVDVLGLVGRGEIKPVVQDTVGLDGIEGAQRLLEDRGVFGKLLLDPTR
ncbi:zinc-binding dehydrogenase [Pseudonocardia sp.]|uniref:zinc-binding dehydrogenase n=1 Tax=Pseudonocardia sp. TaxID=60912 RepID=UPI003D0FEE5C